MSNINVIDGNIFTSNAQTLVNTVNCVGVMGAGIALEHRLRYPEMFEKYVELCERQMIQIGSLWIYKSTDRWILNFPTKRHWKEDTREEYLHAGLEKFVLTYQDKGIESIAFPLLGAQHGNLDKASSQRLMEAYLAKCNIPVEVYRYSPMAPDDLFNRFRDLLIDMSPEEIKEAAGLRIDIAKKVLLALQDQKICQLNRLAVTKGIGVKTLEKVYKFAQSRMLEKSSSAQQELGF